MGSKARQLERLLSRPTFRKLWDGLALLLFVLFVLAPSIYVFTYVFTEWGEIYRRVFSDPIVGDTYWRSMLRAMGLSLQIAAAATLIDVIIGLPMALLLARYEFRGKRLLDALVDLPLAVPSSALGFSIFLFWATGEGVSRLFGVRTGLVSQGPLLILLAHVAFTYSYIVRSLTGVIESIDISYEHAARTLGAPSFTVFRTITSPLAKSGLIAGIILAFARSLGETGATIIVAGIYETAPLAVVSLHQRLLISSAAFLSAILVSIAVFLLLLVRFLSVRVGIPIRRVWPGPERLLSSGKARGLRDAFTFTSFALMILVPSCFTFPYVATWWSSSPYTGKLESGVYYQVFLAPDKKWASLWKSLAASIEVASITTVVDLLLGIPIAVMIVRRRWGHLNELINTLVDVPLAIPTSALGFSVYLFWGFKGLGLFTPGFWLITLTHIAFTYPYAVRSLVAILESLDPSLEEAARTLGAAPLTAFRTITLPLMRPGILAASILAFTRSLGETGATLVVMGNVRTIPILIVQWTESMALPAAAFSCVILIIVSYLLLLLLRYVVRGV